MWGMRSGLAPVAARVALDVPWQPIAGIAGTCLVLAVLSSLLPAALALKR
jgi:putative ABC transport system permease protein